jgi:hypothetical protein
VARTIRVHDLTGSGAGCRRKTVEIHSGIICGISCGSTRATSSWAIIAPSAAAIGAPSTSRSGRRQLGSVIRLRFNAWRGPHLVRIVRQPALGDCVEERLPLQTHR